MFSQKARLDLLEKSNEVLNNENSKFKNEINSYKNEISTYKDKLNVQKSELTQSRACIDKISGELNKTKADYEKLLKGQQETAKKMEEQQIRLSKYEKGCFNESKVIELERKVEGYNSQILQLEANLNDHKQKLKRIEEIERKEYETKIEESMVKIKDLQTNLTLTNEKNKYLESIIHFTDNGRTPKCKKQASSSKKKTQNIYETPKCGSEATVFNIDETDENGFINKKRKKLPKVYQSILDKNLINGGATNQFTKF
jgi:chromosome segregation ATPase